MRSRVLAVLVVVLGATSTLSLAACGGDSTGADVAPKSTPDLTVPNGADALARDASGSTTSTTSTTDTTDTTSTEATPAAPETSAPTDTGAAAPAPAPDPGAGAVVDHGRRLPSDAGRRHGRRGRRRDDRQWRRHRRVGRLQPVLPGQPGRLPGELTFTRERWPAASARPSSASRSGCSTGRVSAFTRSRPSGSGQPPRSARWSPNAPATRRWIPPGRTRAQPGPR